MQRSGTGIAVDKMLALTGQTPALQIANIVMPSEEEREALRETDRKLDEITARLAALQSEQSRMEAKRNGAITAKSIRAAVTRVVYDEEALDVDDIPIPKPAIKYWNRRDEAKGILRQISSIRIEIEKLLPDDPMWCEVNLNGVLAD